MEKGLIEINKEIKNTEKKLERLKKKREELKNTLTFSYESKGKCYFDSSLGLYSRIDNIRQCKDIKGYLLMDTTRIFINDCECSIRKLKNEMMPYTLCKTNAVEISNELFNEIYNKVYNELSNHTITEYEKV